MSRQLKNKVKAVLLLLVFSASTIAGFACSIGMNMGYNQGHHQHNKKEAITIADNHHNHHNHPGKTAEKSEGEKENKTKDCCGEIARLNLTENSLVNSIILQAPVFILAYASTFLFPEITVPSLLDNCTSHSLRRSWNFHNHTDLRIVIQSFQI